MAAEGPGAPAARTLCGVRLFPQRQPVDVGLRNGRVVSIGSAESVPRRRDRQAGEDVDAKGLFLLPGFQDAHVHTVQEAARRHRLDLRPATSAAHAAAMVGVAHAEQLADPAAADDVLLGQGFRAGLWDDEPTAELLADAAPGRPVLLQSNDLHVAWLSPAALRLAGRDPGSAGLLRERECFEAVARLASPPSNRSDRWVAELTVDAAARGVTTLFDFEFADTLVDWTRRVRAQQVATRVVCVVPLHLARRGRRPRPADRRRAAGYRWSARGRTAQAVPRRLPEQPDSAVPRPVPRLRRPRDSGAARRRGGACRPPRMA